MSHLIKKGKHHLIYFRVIKTNITPPLFIEVPEPIQDNQRLCIYVLRVSILPLCTILIFDLLQVPALSVVFLCFSFQYFKNDAYSPTLLIFSLFYFKVPGHLRTINSPIYGKEDNKLDIIKDKYEIDDSDLNTNTQTDNVYEEISDENSINMDPRYINTSPIHDV